MTAEAATAGHTVRLLAGYHELGRAAGLRDHLASYGPPPLPGMSARSRPARQVIQMIEGAGLTGRGGGAFPTGRKMRSVAVSKRWAVVVVNAAEGEPASGKDQALLTIAPHLVLDGAALAAHAVGARRIIVCVHAGNDVADDIERAVSERDRAHLTTVPIQVCEVPVRYVAGEETSLVNWINGGEAKPMFTPPRPYERGVNGRPTLVSNAETYAHIALITRFGADWFRSCGSPDAPGTALFTVTGAVAAPGVVEAPLGTTVADLLLMAGGPSEQLQAVLAGGYGGTWLPLPMVHTPTTPAAFRAAGLALGPGIIVALPARACGLAETARVLAWLAEETAGQCGPCVFGLPAIAEDFAAIAGCRTDAWVYRRLRERLSVIPGRGACRHPDGAVRFAASALQVFRPHVEFHERTGRCLAAHRPGTLPLPGTR